MGRDMKVYELTTDQIPGVPQGKKSVFNPTNGRHFFYGRNEYVEYSFIDDEKVVVNMTKAGIIKEVIDYKQEIQKMSWVTNNDDNRCWATHPNLNLTIYADSFKDIYEIIAKT